VPTWKQQACSGEGRCPVVPLVFKNSGRLFQLINQDGELVITLRFFAFSVFSLLARFFMSCTKPGFSVILINELIKTHVGKKPARFVVG
jgi:hypothetical protein